MESGRQAIKKDESVKTHPFLLPWIGFLILSFQNPCILEVWSVFCFDCIAAVRSIGFVIETGDDHTKHTLFVFSQNSVISVVLHTFFQSVSICFVLETADNDTVTFQSACISPCAALILSARVLTLEVLGLETGVTSSTTSSSSTTSTGAVDSFLLLVRKQP